MDIQEKIERILTDNKFTRDSKTDPSFDHLYIKPALLGSKILFFVLDLRKIQDQNQFNFRELILDYTDWALKNIDRKIRADQFGLNLIIYTDNTPSDLEVNNLVSLHALKDPYAFSMKPHRLINNTKDVLVQSISVINPEIKQVHQEKTWIVIGKTRTVLKSINDLF